MHLFIHTHYGKTQKYVLLFIKYFIYTDFMMLSLAMDGAELSPKTMTESIQNYAAQVSTFRNFCETERWKSISGGETWFWQKCHNRVNSANLMPFQYLLNTITVL